MQADLHWIDIAIVVAFIGYQSWLGLRRPKGSDRQSFDYLLDGRRLTMPAFVATLVTTWYGGILGVGEYSYQYGISNWLVFGVPYYLWALVFALFLARKARRSLFVSISDHLEKSYGPAAGTIGALIVFLMTVPAAYVLMLGVLTRWMLGWPLWVGVSLGAILSIIYVQINGFRAVIRTDKIQFVLMFAAFAVLLPVCVSKIGGWSTIKTLLPGDHLTWHGGNTTAYIVSWYFIAAATLVEPSFYQRCYAARNESTAVRGIVASIGCWFVFDFLTTFTGLYARAALPDLADPQTSFPALAVRVLPVGMIGVFFAGLFATIMSTVDSYSLLSAICLGRDVLWRRFGKDTHGVNRLGEIGWTRVALIASGVLAVVLAILQESVIGLWKLLGSIGVPALVLPVLYTFFGRKSVSSFSATIWIVCGALAGLLGNLLHGEFAEALWVTEPIYMGLLVSLLVGTWVVSRAPESQ